MKATAIVLLALSCIAALGCASGREEQMAATNMSAANVAGQWSGFVRSGGTTVREDLRDAMKLYWILDELKHRLPTISAYADMTRHGLLLSYGADLSVMSRRAAVFVDKILKGAKPTDLPVEQPTKFELVINLKTAKSLGLAIPPSVLGRADHIIQ